MFVHDVNAGMDNSIIQVTVKGTGKTRQQAVTNAKHNAVEQVMGVYIKSDVKMSMGLIVSDEVSSRKEGYIEKYEVVSEGPDPINTYMVEMLVTVNKKKIRYDVNRIYNKDPEELIQFSKNKFLSRKIIVCHKTTHESNNDNQSMAVERMLSHIRDELVDYGFRVFLQNELAKIKQHIINHTVDKKAAIAFGKQQMADVVIMVHYEYNTEKTQDGYIQILGTAILSCFDVTTGQLFANEEYSRSSLSKNSKYHVRKATNYLTEQLGKQVVGKLVTKLVHRFTKLRQNMTSLIIKDVQAMTQSQAERILETLGWDYKITSYIRSIIEIEIFNNLSPTEIQQKFIEECQRHQLNLSLVELKGSRVLFTVKLSDE
jgi:hypothetical protein